MNALLRPPYRKSFPWSRTHWFWGDERFVPYDDALSNYRMVRQALLSRAPIPARNVHPIPPKGSAPKRRRPLMNANSNPSTVRSGSTRLDRSSM